MEANGELRLMFMDVLELDSGDVFRGGFLTTDKSTKPLEFRCTAPIRPTSLQKILYGNFLRQHMLIELFAVPLFKQSREKPTMILIKDEDFLGLRKEVNLPVLWIGKHIDSANILSKDADAENHTITSPSGNYEPIIVTTHHEYLSELSEHRPLLSQVMAEHDILEPFERIKIALESVHKHKMGE